MMGFMPTRIDAPCMQCCIIIISINFIGFLFSFISKFNLLIIIIVVFYCILFFLYY